MIGRSVVIVVPAVVDRVVSLAESKQIIIFFGLFEVCTQIFHGYWDDIFKTERADL